MSGTRDSAAGRLDGFGAWTPWQPGRSGGLNGHVVNVTTGDYLALMRVVGTRQLMSTLPVRDELEHTLHMLAQSGAAQPPRTSRVGWSWQPTGASLPDGTVNRLLEGLRAERGERT